MLTTFPQKRSGEERKSITYTSCSEGLSCMAVLGVGAGSKGPGFGDHTRGDPTPKHTKIVHLNDRKRRWRMDRKTKQRCGHRARMELETSRTPEPRRDLCSTVQTARWISVLSMHVKESIVLPTEWRVSPFSWSYSTATDEWASSVPTRHATATGCIMSVSNVNTRLSEMKPGPPVSYVPCILPPFRNIRYFSFV
jgi:hypothetical protein